MLMEKSTELSMLGTRTTAVALFIGHWHEAHLVSLDTLAGCFTWVQIDITQPFLVQLLFTDLEIRG